jgi:hypothetical protein
MLEFESVRSVSLAAPEGATWLGLHDNELSPGLVAVSQFAPPSAINCATLLGAATTGAATAAIAIANTEIFWRAVNLLNFMFTPDGSTTHARVRLQPDSATS